MGKDEQLAETFTALRALLQKHAKHLRVLVDKKGDFQVASPTLVDRTGKPLFVAAAQVKKNYVSFHFMPVYAIAGLKSSLSPALQKRMQGKGCFNFQTLDQDQLRELAFLTRQGLKEFENIELPWASR
jgi:hypothetical protein